MFQHITAVDLWRNLCTSLLYFVVRVRCRRKKSSRSLSHLLMSFLLYVWNQRVEEKIVNVNREQKNACKIVQESMCDVAKNAEHLGTSDHIYNNMHMSSLCSTTYVAC